jgi:hypothetical protein
MFVAADGGPHAEETSGARRRPRRRDRSAAMSCRKGKYKTKPKVGAFRCAECGAVVKQKKDVCEPKKIKK